MNENIWKFMIDDKYNEQQIRKPQDNPDFNYSKLEEHRTNWDIEFPNTDDGYEKYYAVIIPGYYHSTGKGICNCYIYPRNEKPNKSNVIPFNGDPVLYGVSFEPVRYIRNKYNIKSIEQSCKCYITRNGKKFYTISGRDMDYCLAKAKTIISEVQEHTIEFNEIDYDINLIGRVIKYNGVLSVINRICDNCCCIINPVNTDIFENGEKFLKIDYLDDKKINWYPATNN